MGFYLGEKHLKEQRENWKSKNVKSGNINLSKNWCWLGGEGFTHPTTRGSYHAINLFSWPAQPNLLFWSVILRLLLWFLVQSWPLSVPSHMKSLCGHMLERGLVQRAPQTLSLPFSCFFAGSSVTSALCWQQQTHDESNAPLLGRK